LTPGAAQRVSQALINLPGDSGMPGSGAIFIGKMFEALPVTLIVFAVAYSTAKKKKGLKNSAARVGGLLLWTFVVTGVAFAIFYDAINTGFGMAAESGMQGIFEVPAQFLLAALASVLVINAIGKTPEKPEVGSGKQV
jgi:uncharacterized membrane protein